MDDSSQTHPYLELARSVADTEASAISQIKSRLDQAFVKAVNLCLSCKGRIVVTGIGKSGHIAGKIASTLASTGTPAFFVHPSEACHGDLGMITSKDVVLALSYSGASDELTIILPLIKRLHTPLIAMTGRHHSLLGQHADVILDISVDKEACPLGLAPTSSTTAALVMGDALAIVLLKERGFTAEDFARSHPGGTLGRKLLLSAKDLMHTGDAIPIATPETPLNQALVIMTHKRFGCINVVDEKGAILGIFTDGDLRRMLDRGIDIHATLIKDVMTKNCITTSEITLATELIRTMSQKKITVITVTDLEEKPIGIIHMHDLIQAGVSK